MKECITNYIVQVRDNDKHEWGTSHWAIKGYPLEEARQWRVKLSRMFVQTRIMKQTIIYEEVREII